ncbi:endoribonuclease L-PSP family protein-like protein [Tothia fuscella]|uniref:Endoribonuclease L-PSP family protein-like protein n=1 Tax=Tothia fuscella TaxID=1048955 RepID=A0A9P4NKH4_9PEZI|nr:endoribonuclease L-PSP family protein-like protein [Tothia fuscella]
MADSNKPFAIDPPNVAPAPETYRQVAITSILPTSKLITLAGQCGIEPSTGKVPSPTGNRSEDLIAQARLAYSNVLECLKAVGATPRDVIHVRHYVVKSTGDPAVDATEIVERGWGKLWCEFMDREGGGHRPPDTVLGVASLAKHDLMYEVEVWAIIHN